MANRLNDIFNLDALAETQDYANSLNTPIPQGLVHTYRPGWDAQLVAEQEAAANPLVFAPAMQESVAKAGDIASGKGVGLGEMASRLLGVGQERYQAWPEKIVRSGFSLPHDVVTGEVPVRDAEGRTSPELIERTQDLSGLMGGGFTAKPNALVAAAESSHNAPIAALANAPRFYSAVEHAVNNSKTKVASADQWLGELRNQPGVKAEELDWVLHDLPKGQISKAELEEFVKGHKIELKEVTKGQNDIPKYEIVSDTTAEDGTHSIKIKSNSGKIYEVDKDPHSQSYYDVLEMHPNKPGIVAANLNVRGGSRPETLAEIKALITAHEQGDNFSGDVAQGPKYSQWQLPGGSNYREHLLTLPENTKISDRIKAINARMEKIQDEFDTIDRTTPDSAALAERRKNLYNEKTDLYKELTGLHQDAIPNPNYKSSHWSEPNVLAHIRTNERDIPSVGKSLHVEEIQSDWHQKGRKEGYKGEKEELQPKFDKIEEKIMASNDESILANPELKDALKTAVDKGIITKEEAKTYERYTNIESGSPVPDAPFKSNWPDLALKRIIRQAAEEGKDAVSWTPGEAQAKRYQLSNQVSSINWEPSQLGQDTKLVRIKTQEGKTINLQVNKSGKVESSFPSSQGGQFEGRNLADVIGKEPAEKIVNERIGTMSGNGLNFGGEGMKAFYDKMLVDKANAIAKRFGGKVEQSGIEDAKKQYEIINRDGTRKVTDDIKEAAEAAKDIEVIVNTINDKQPIHILRITPQLRDAALSKGFALFADTGKVGAPIAALTKVDHNPFKLGEMEKQHGVTLKPVEHNPFTTDAYHGAPYPFKGERVRPMSGIEIIDQYGTFAVKDSVANKILAKDFKTQNDAHDWIDKKGFSDFYSASHPDLSNDYALKMQGYSGLSHFAAPHVMPLKLNTKDYHVVDAKGQPWDAVNTQAIFEANQLGKKGVTIHNVLDDADPRMMGSRGPRTVNITLDASTVRSKNAKFDPAKFHESGLLKASSLPVYSDENGNQLMPPPVNPSKIDLPTPPAWVTGLGIKAAEWGLYFANRGNPNVTGPMWVATMAQWPLLSLNLKGEIARQRAQGKNIQQILKDTPILQDIMALNPPPKLIPVEGNPFNEQASASR